MGYTTKIHGKDHWVEESILRKGDFLDIILIDINGGEVSATLIYNWTGKYVGDLFENLLVAQEQTPETQTK